MFIEYIAKISGAAFCVRLIFLLCHIYLIKVNQLFSLAKLFLIFSAMMLKRLDGTENKTVSDAMYFLIAGSNAPTVAFGWFLFFSLYGIVHML